MSSVLKPALPPGGAASPTKTAAVPPAQPPRGPPLVGQNLVHHQPTPAHPAQGPAHVAMSPVSQNMAQMAQNMSHHGNLSHIGQNNVPPVSTSNGSPQPSKAAASAPVNLVQGKCLTGASQPLALIAENKDEASSAPAQTNGTSDSNSPATPAEPVAAEDAEKSKSEPNIPANSPAKPAEASSAKPENSPAKADKSPAKPNENPCDPNSAENQLQVNKLGSSTDVAGKASPAKPTEGTEPSHEAAAAPIASAASSEPKLPDESANVKTNSPQEPTSTQATLSDIKPSDTESKAAVADSTATPEAASEAPLAKEPSQEAKQTPTKENKLPVKEVQKSPPKEEPKKEESNEIAQAPAVPAKKVEPKTPATKSTMKLATVTPPVRKRRQDTPAKHDGVVSAKKMAGDDLSTPDSRLSKRNRTKVQPYQIPTPELAMATKLSASAGRSTPTKPGDDKLTVFYKNEYLAVRNAEGSFYVCQAMQNVYRSTRKIKIRWLSQDKTLDPSGNTYKPDFYDVTDLECVLTTLSLTRSSKGGGAQLLSAAEAARAKSILERAISAEQTGQSSLQVTEEHPDGLDLSLYKDESQLEKKKARKRQAAADESDDDREDDDEEDEEETPSKRAKRTPKKSPKTPKAKSAAKSDINKRKSAPGSTPVANKTALVPDKKETPKSAKKGKVPTPAKKTPAKPAKETPKAAPARATPPAKATPPVKAATPAKGNKTPRKSDRESKLAALAATPSTSTGKATRTPRKPPSTKRSSAFILR